MTLLESIQAEQARRGQEAEQAADLAKRQRLADDTKLRNARNWVRDRLQPLDGKLGLDIVWDQGDVTTVAILHSKGRKLLVTVDWLYYEFRGSDEVAPVDLKNIQVVLTDVRYGQISSALLLRVDDEHMKYLDKTLTDWVLR
jgi:hypothetical protein